MPKMLFSKRQISDLRDLIDNVKRPKRADPVVNRKRQKRDIQGILIKDNNNGSFTSKLRPQGDNRFHPSLEDVLRDKKCFTAFQAFLRSEFSNENIEFWQACEKYRKAISAEERSCKAVQIYQDFIHPKAHREINVDHCIKERIRTSLNEPGHSCFEEAQKQVYKLMETDSFPRFLRSEAYSNLKFKTKTLWYI